MREKYLQGYKDGTNDIGDEVGAASHSHSFSGSEIIPNHNHSITQTKFNEGEADAITVDTGSPTNDAGEDTVTISGTTGTGSSIPPSVLINYIIKI